MSAIGGPLKTLSLNKREFRGTGDSNVDLKLGGYDGEYKANGDKSARKTMTPALWTVDGAAVEIDMDNEDLEFIYDVKNGRDDVPVVVTLVDDTSYSGLGGIEGEVTHSSADATAAFALKGGGDLKKL